MRLPDPFIPLRPWLEQAWLQRYLERELAPDEQAWFETYLLTRPHLLAALEADSALRAVLAAPAAGQLFAATAPEPTEPAPPEPATSALPGRRPGALLALAASFIGGIGLASLLLPATRPAADAPPGIEAPARLSFDPLRLRPGDLHEAPGDPRASHVVVDIVLPAGSRIASAHAMLAERRIALPSAALSGEGLATYTLPRSWQGRARLHFELQTAAGARLPAVEGVL